MRQGSAFKGRCTPRGRSGTLVCFSNWLVNRASTTRTQRVAAYHSRDSVLGYSSRLCLCVQIEIRSDRRYSPRFSIPNPYRWVFLFGRCIQRTLSDILAPNNGTPGYKNPCIQSALAKGAASTTIDAVGLLPEGGAVAGAFSLWHGAAGVSNGINILSRVQFGQTDSDRTKRTVTDGT